MKSDTLMDSLIWDAEISLDESVVKRRQKNLRINRNNIANIQLDKKGQAVQVQLKSAIIPDKSGTADNNSSIVLNNAFK